MYVFHKALFDIGSTANPELESLMKLGNESTRIVDTNLVNETDRATSTCEFSTTFSTSLSAFFTLVPGVEGPDAQRVYRI